MTEHYVTVFDHKFLSQGLALHRSMQRHCGAFKLWIIAMETQTEEALGRLESADVEVIPVTRLETNALRDAKSNRGSKEYCWTITPFGPSAVGLLTV